MGKKFEDIQGKEIRAENIKEGIWIMTERRAQHRLHDLIPRKCDLCGFPAMEILVKDFEHQSIRLGCPWCNVHRELCLVCGEMGYLLPRDHSH